MYPQPHDKAFVLQCLITEDQSIEDEVVHHVPMQSKLFLKSSKTKWLELL